MSVLLLLALQAVPVAEPHTWFADFVYPPAAVRAGDEGRVEYRLDVNTAGEVVACRIILSSGSAVLDAATCDHLMKAAKFVPAAPAAAGLRAYDSAATFRLPDGSDHAYVGPLKRQITMTVSLKKVPRDWSGKPTDLIVTATPEGRASNCRIEESSGVGKLDEFACSILINRARFYPSLQAIDGVRYRVNWSDGN